MAERTSQPTEEDFAQLATRMEAYERMDKVELARLRELWHINPPEPYSTLFAELTSAKESLQKLAERIENDPHFTAEERYAAYQELFERWQHVVKAQAGEGFND